MVKFKDFSRPLSVFQLLFKAILIFKDFSRQSCIFKYFSSLCEPCKGQIQPPHCALGHTSQHPLNIFYMIIRKKMATKPQYTQYAPSRLAQSVMCLARDASLTADSGVASSIPARSHIFVKIGREIISTVILLPSA